MRPVGCVAAVVALAAIPSPGWAASVVDQPGPAGAKFSPGGGERNDLTISEDARGRLLFRDRGAPVVARSGCKQLGYRRARCPRPVPPGGLDINLGDRDDRLIVKSGYRTTIRGGNGDDWVKGGFGVDFIRGGQGSDSLRGRGGNDGVIGSGSGSYPDGDDTIRGGDGDDSLNGGKGDDRIEGRDGDDAIGGNSGKDLIRGGDGDDGIDGRGGDDHIEGRDGDDRVYGRGGDDLIRGGRGADTLYGNHGRDHIQGRDGDDRIVGGHARDLVKGGNGADSVSGSDDGDTVQGRAGDDRLSGGPGKDRVEGHQGDDILNGNDDADDLNGGEGDDLHIARDDPNTAPGTPGGHHDRVNCGDEADIARTDSNDTVIPDCELIPLWDEALTVAPFPVAIDHDADTLTLHVFCHAPEGCRGEFHVEGTEGEDFSADGEFDLPPQNAGDPPATVSVAMRGQDDLLRNGLLVRVVAEPSADMTLPGGTGGYRGVFEG